MSFLDVHYRIENEGKHFIWAMVGSMLDIVNTGNGHESQVNWNPNENMLMTIPRPLPWYIMQVVTCICSPRGSSGGHTPPASSSFQKRFMSATCWTMHIQKNTYGGVPWWVTLVYATTLIGNGCGDMKRPEKQLCRALKRIHPPKMHGPMDQK